MVTVAFVAMATVVGALVAFCVIFPELLLDIVTLSALADILLALVGALVVGDAPVVTPWVVEGLLGVVV
jgi:hypothetical protein